MKTFEDEVRLYIHKAYLVEYTVAEDYSFTTIGYSAGRMEMISHLVEKYYPDAQFNHRLEKYEHWGRPVAEIVTGGGMHKELDDRYKFIRIHFDA